MIGIIGYGYVGQATHKLLGKVDCILDINSTPDDYDKMRNCDIIFICLPTPERYDGSCDTSIIENWLDFLGTEPLYVIRSTVPWTWKPEGYRVVAAPEFLMQNLFLRTSNSTQLLGGVYKDLQPVIELYETLDIQYVCTTWEAAWQTKYTSNMYGAFKVLFWEMVQDITGNERLVYDLWKSIGIKQGDMAQVGMDGTRGFSGACFPKDTKAMLALTQHPLLKALLEYNEGLNRGSESTKD